MHLISQNYFRLCHDGFENFLPNKEYGITLVSAQVNYRKDMLNIYLRHDLTQNHWNETFLKYLSQVGEFHTDKGDAASVNIKVLCSILRLRLK
jgi:hypothetical protein